MQKHPLRFPLIFLFLTGVVILFFAGKDYFETRAFLGYALKAQGSVVGMQTNRDTNGDEIYAPVVAFQDNLGNEQKTVSRIASNPPDFEIGDSVEVFYDPQNIENTKLNSFFQLYSISLVLSIIGGLFTFIGGTVIALWIRRARLKKWLLANGEVVEAEVSSVSLDTSMRVNGRSPYRIKCQYPDSSSGVLREYKSDKLWIDPTGYLKEKIKVYRDPANMKRYYVFTDDIVPTN